MTRRSSTRASSVLFCCGHRFGQEEQRGDAVRKLVQRAAEVLVGLRAAAAEEPGNEVVPPSERRDGRRLLPPCIDHFHAFERALNPGAVIQSLGQAERLSQLAHVRGEPVVAFRPVGPQPSRRLARRDPAFERRPALALRGVTADPVGRARQLPRSLEVRRGARAPNLHGTLRGGQVLALSIQLIRDVGRAAAAAPGGRGERGWRKRNGSRFRIHGSWFTGASSTRTLNLEP